MRIRRFILVLTIILNCLFTFSQTAIITDDPAYASGNASSVLDIKSTSKGVLIPRLSQTERGQIISPATGLLIYQTNNTPGFYYYNGSLWSLVGTGSSPDGSETRFNSGTNLTVAGSGTSGSPYSIAFSAQSISLAQRNAIATPYAGQFVWCNNCGAAGEYQVFNGSSWTNMCGGVASTANPSVTTTAASLITQTTATSGGNITDNGGATVTFRGICFSTSQNPTISDPHTVEAAGSGSFSAPLSGLTPYTIYYVRAYATSSDGTFYGNQISFTTLQGVPTLTTTAITSITSYSASSGGTISSNGGAAVTARGVCWSTSSNPTTANSKTTDGSGSGSFSSSLTGLASGTQYYVRAYATNSVGTAYGDQQVFTTGVPSLPTVTTTTPWSITGTQAFSGGNVTSDGGGLLTAVGVCWSTSANPTISDSKTNAGTSVGVFQTPITGLSLGTLYHVRAYATNGAGTSYGSDISFRALKEGDSFGGGIVFYFDGLNGLIGSTVDLTNASWGCSGTDLTGAAGQAVFTGSQNTTDIINGCATPGIAARICRAYNGGGYNDWYLPSIDELNRMAWTDVNYNWFNMVANTYWTSTEMNASQSVSHTTRPITYNWYDDKNTVRGVRAVRAF